MLSGEAPSFIKRIIYLTSEIITDQRKYPRHAGNLIGRDMVPDVVKCLREFSSNSKEFASQKNSVERILNMYENEQGSPRYFDIIIMS